MTPAACPYEQDVLDAIDARRWPDRCDADLRAHVAQCPICADLGHVASVLREDHERWWQQASVPPASEVWWRARMRARAEAERAVARPVLATQVTLAAVIVALAGAWLGPGVAPAVAGWRVGVASGWRALLDTLATAPAALDGVAALPPAVWFLAGLWLLLVPAAVYAATRE